MLSERSKGVLLMVGASVCFSTAGVVVRHIETVNATGIVFWRSVFMSVFLGALLAVPVSFTINYIVLRRAAAVTDPTVAALMAAIVSVLVAAPLAWPLVASGRDLLLLAALGFFQTGLGLALMTRAYHRLQAGELALIGLLESVLAPIWVWLAIGERPGDAALAGGVIVIGAVLANQLLGLRPRKAGAAAAQAPRG
jgi:drug/metabolite transporter (DMT)-like permease